MTSLDALQELREFDTALLANTLGYISAVPAHEFYMAGSIRSLTPEIGPVVGLAQTAKVDTSTPGGAPELNLFIAQQERMADMQLPSLWLVETVGSRPEHECVTGDGMAKSLFSAGCLGVITDGYCRDIAGCQSVPFAVYCRGTIAHHAPLRIPEVDSPVEVGGLQVESLNIIHADREGVIKIPPDDVATLIKRAPQMRAFEHDVHAMLRRTDLRPREKYEHVAEFLQHYGFSR